MLVAAFPRYVRVAHNFLSCVCWQPAEGASCKAAQYGACVLVWW